MYGLVRSCHLYIERWNFFSSKQIHSSKQPGIQAASQLWMCNWKLPMQSTYNHPPYFIFILSINTFMTKKYIIIINRIEWTTYYIKRAIAIITNVIIVYFVCKNGSLIINSLTCKDDSWHEAIWNKRRECEREHFLCKCACFLCVCVRAVGSFVQTLIHSQIHEFIVMYG